MSLQPIITICGTTGVGKSKLAIDLALYINRHCKKFGWRAAKVINADAMQVYKGLDIITNKVPESERQGIPHLLMGFKHPGEQYMVGEWVQDAIKLIHQMHTNNELPIIVGGTSYWIQHLLFPDRLVSKELNRTPSCVLSKPQSWPPELKKLIDSLPLELLDLMQNLPAEPPAATDLDPTFRLYSLLSILDPVISQRWHWKDSRKVLRSLEILMETKKRPSDIIFEQSSIAADHKPRYRTLSFWLYAELSELRPRLDARVDDMILQGLLDEVRWMQESENSHSSEATSDANPTVNYTLGIYQSIGYREFCGYLKDPTRKVYIEAVERMKISTRQYAKRQVSWIRNKLIPAIDAANVREPIAPLYLLDATVLGDSWRTNVQEPATSILNSFLDGANLPDPKLLSAIASRMLDVKQKDVDPTAVLEARKKRICPTCTLEPDRPVMIEEGEQWDIHQRTRGHRRLATKNTQGYFNAVTIGS